MKLTNCNCGEKVDCGCELEFDYYETDTTSVLTVGNLVDVASSANCEFTDYVIDWYYESDPDIKFTTGAGDDPDITYTHPFIGIESIPVEGGTWKPIVRYIVIAGAKIFTSPKSCQKWCDMTINLPEIEVNPFTCSSSVGPYAVYYTHRLEYNCLINKVEDAEQTVRFNLDTDGSVTDFAWYFNGYEIADRITFIYCDVDGNELETLGDWVVGTDTEWNLSSTPKHIKTTYIKRVIHLPTYTLGDFLKIKIIPSYVSGNPLTMWLLDMKCLYSFSCLELTANMQTPDEESIEVTYNETECRYEVNFETLAIPPNPYSYDFGKYFINYIIWSGQGVLTWYDGQVTFYLYDEYVRGYFGYPIYTGNSVIQHGNCTIQKSGTTLTITFENETDYLAWKTSWNNVLANSHWTDYSSDPTNILHYKYIYLIYKDVQVEGTPGETCADPGVAYGYYIAYDSVYDSGTGFDDINFVIVIELVEDENGYSDISCSDVYDVVNYRVGYANSLRSSDNFTKTINCRYANPFTFYYGYTVTQPAQTSFKYFEALTVYNYSFDDGPCEIWDLLDTIVYPQNTQYLYYMAALYITLTEESGTTYWHAYSVLDENGRMLTNPGDYTLIAEGEVV